ncbi:MAG: CofH family radical SAM protein [Verrucomicrobia bacterium]|nr:CofH family radical SAM protein [Verrucomicrobiota bacterium]
MIAKIADKVRADVRLSAEEGLALLTSHEIEAVCQLADEVRERKVGNQVLYASTLYIHPTNLCELSCPMCSFYAKPGWKTSWFLTPQQVLEKVEKALPFQLSEIHFVGGLWRDCNLDYYREVFQGIKAMAPTLHIKALTPVEYDFLAKLHGIPVEEVLQRMISWGLGSLPGGGAEILVEEIRKQLAPQKITTEEYLDIHRKAHRMGLPSNITMLFGHVEEPHDLIAHLLRVRELQDETQGFLSFVPLRYHTENNALGKRAKRLKPPPDLRLLYAVCRLMLDNIPHLKVLWKYVGIEMAQTILQCGANDFSSTYEGEMIIEMAGSLKAEMKQTRIEELISQIGRIPKQVHSGRECVSA